MKLFVGVKALIVREGKVLLLREAVYDEGSHAGEWDVPGGRIQPEETLFAGLAREVFEEVGLEVQPGIVLSVQETFPTIKGEPCHIVRIHYLAEYVAGEVVLSSDHDRFEWVSDESQLADKVCMSGVASLVRNYFAKQDK
jgi:8-oxo-dGTP diphosphatase